MQRSERLVCTIAVVSILAAMFAFRHVRAEDWLPIPPEDLALKDNPANPGADAMILYRDSVVNSKTVVESGDFDEEYMRIKIFTQAGVRKGDVEVDFFKDQSDVKDIRGRTIHPDGTIVEFRGNPLEKEIVKRSGIRLLAKTFTLPDVQPGSIIEYKYRVQSNPRYLRDERWIVSSDLFTREAHFSYVPYEGYTGFVPMIRSYGLPAEAKPQCSVNGTCTMIARNVLAVVDEALMPPPTMLEARVEFYNQPLGEPRGENPEAYWTRVSKKLNGELDHFIDARGALTSQLPEIVDPNDTPEAKLRKIYARVLKIRNLSFEDPRTQKEEREEELKHINNISDVVTNKYGTDSDINYLLVSMARAVGFEASDVRIASRNDHVFVPAAEDARDLNAEVVWVSAGGKEYYLDPGAKYFPFGLLPWFETNTQGLRLTKKGGDQIATPSSASSDATIVRTADLSMSEIGALSGTLRVDFTGQEGALRREENRNGDEIGRKKAIEDEMKGWLPLTASLDNTTISNWDAIEEPLHVETTLKIAGFASSAGRRVLIPAEIFRSSQVAAFEPQNRVNMIYFHYPYEEIDDLKIHAPKGYKIASVPTPPKLDRGPVTYELSATQQEDTAEIKRHLAVKGVLFPKDTYLALRAFFNSVRTNDDSQLVLQNAGAAQN